MIKEIVRDEEALAVPSEPATAEDAQVAQDLIDTITSMDDVIMLAANQIGAQKNMIVYLGPDGKPHVLFNPSIKQAMRPSKTVESCLSVERDTPVTRFQTITVNYQVLSNGELLSRSRKYTDFLAQVIQHGIDHCKGTVI